MPGASAGGGGAGSSLRADITAPAFELTGCTVNQDDVARLMSRLRLVNRVTRVSFSNSQESSASELGVGVRRRLGQQQRAGMRPDPRPRST